MIPTRSAAAKAALLAAAATLASSARADEGMWTYNRFPAAQVGQAHGATPTPDFLDHLRLSSLKMGNGCSSSLVSSDGLVMTNHHCARTCIDNLAGLTHHDYFRDGFLAKTPAQEARCPGLELDRLERIEDVTARVQAATAGVPEAKFEDAQKAAIADIEKQCATSEDRRCDVVTLYSGGRYDLYTYRRFTDARLVFAPEEGIAFFGGDPDNFNFPRYDLDVSFLRLYGADGQPVHGIEHFAWATAPLKEGDLTYVSGHPGGTLRELTLAQFADERDWRTPLRIARLAEKRGLLTGFQQRGAAQKLVATDDLFGTENGLKVYIGRHEALADTAFWNQLAAGEADFRARVAKDPALAAEAGGAWDAIAALVQKSHDTRKAWQAFETDPLDSDLFVMARRIVRAADEAGKPNGERLKEYTDAKMPQVRQAVLANRPISDELEIALLTWDLTKVREDLGPDHPFIRRVYGQRSPLQIATAAVKGTKLKDLQVDARGNATGGFRKRLLDGGKAAVDASTDPMIALARAFDPDARAVRHVVETEIDGPMHRQQELIAKARFAVYGESKAPDATGTLRLSYGTVKGWTTQGRAVPPFTTIGGAFQRATGAEPFALPPSWLHARERLNLDTPFDLVTDNDIIGGNSGSPLVDRSGRVTGLIFDGNIESLGGDYGFDASVNRAVSVDARALMEALRNVYGAKRIVDELERSQHEVGAAR